MTYTVEHASGLREFFHLRRDPLAWFAEAAQRGIDIRTLRIGSRHIFQLNHPDLIRDVLITHDWNFVKGRGLRASRPVLGQGLLTSEGELHRRQRRLVQPAFHSARLASYADTMTACANSTCRTWTDGSVIAIDQEMMRLTLRIVGRTLFSADLASGAAGVSASLTRALKLFLHLNSPITQLFPPLRHYREREAAKLRAELAAVLAPVIREHRAYPERYDDMLSMLLRSTDDSGAGFLSDDLLLDEALTLFLAGHETTANALTFTWLLLAQHPQAAARLHDEVDCVLGGHLPTYDAVPRLTHTGRVFREALRLYPPAWLIARDAVTSYRFGSLDVPANSTVFMSPFATQRDPRYWPDPERFLPERFADSAVERPRFAFYPFGAGTRACVGEHFAWMEGTLLLATLAQRWQLHLASSQRVELWPQITLRPRRPLLMRVEARQPRRAFLMPGQGSQRTCAQPSVY